MPPRSSAAGFLSPRSATARRRVPVCVVCLLLGGLLFTLNQLPPNRYILGACLFAIGFLLIALGWYGSFQLWRGGLERQRWFLQVLRRSWPLGFVALLAAQLRRWRSMRAVGARPARNPSGPGGEARGGGEEGRNFKQKTIPTLH